MRWPPRFLIFFGVVLLVAAAFYVVYARSQEKLNVVIISIDTLRPDHMGVYGYEKNTTPNIDAWAKNAVAFTNVSTVVPMTYPSFVALMTGRDPFHTQIFKNKDPLLSTNIKSLPTYLKEQGYTTAAFTTGAVSPRYTKLDQGVDRHSYMVYKQYRVKNDKELYFQGNRERYEAFVESAADWVKENKKKPFFLWVHLMDPHAPYAPPYELECKFNESMCSYIRNVNMRDLEFERADNQGCREEPPAKETFDAMETLYDGGVAYSDQLAGTILTALKQSGLDKNTLVVLYGDHGEGFDHNYYFNHRAVLYDSAVKIPLIIKHPKNIFSGKSDWFLQNTDILPTILDVLGMKYNTNALQGSSFQQALFNNPVAQLLGRNKRQYAIMTNHAKTKFAISDGTFKYIYSLQNACLNKEQTEELYNLTKDPGELVNIVNNEKSVKERLKKNLMDYLSQYNLPEKLADSGFEEGDLAGESDALKALPY